MILDGLRATLLIAGIGFIIGFVLGTFIAMIRTNPSKHPAMKAAQWACSGYVLLIRALPVVVQLLLGFFVIAYAIFGGGTNPLIVGIVIYGINSSAYQSESIRGAINGIDKGQLEAGYSVGMTYRQTMFRAILPQAYKNAIPQLGNELIILVKETAIVGFITVLDLVGAFQRAVNITFAVAAGYILLAMIYFIIVGLLTLLIMFVEKVVFKQGGFDRKSRRRKYE